MYALEQELSQDIKNHVEWLRYNVQPWSRVITSWQVTSKLRIHELKNNDKGKQNKKSNIHEYIIQYPALNTLKGYSLVYILINMLYIYKYIQIYMYVILFILVIYYMFHYFIFNFFTF